MSMTGIKERQLQRSVEKGLRAAKINFVREPVIGKTQPDYLVTTPAGDQIIIEVKGWPASAENVSRANHQAQRYIELSNVAGALIVTQSVTLFRSATGETFSSSGLNRAIANAVTGPAASIRKVRAPKRAKSKRVIFASMPFASKYDDTFLVAIEPAAIAVNAKAERVDHGGKAGDLVQQIRRFIDAAAIVVADLSESRPNVCHEVGYAEALGRRVIQICSTSLDDLPFNLRNNRTIGYSIGQTAKLRSRLQSELRKVL